MVPPTVSVFPVLIVIAPQSTVPYVRAVMVALAVVWSLYIIVAGTPVSESQVTALGVPVSTVYGILPDASIMVVAPTVRVLPVLIVTLSVVKFLEASMTVVPWTW